PDSNTSRVARSNNSTGYFLALAITGASPSARTAPGSQVSVKPGMAQRDRRAAKTTAKLKLAA
ncbi:MAG TPA: hypothetical protein VFB42_00925, partial [Gaiellaceae bacterium]|nr:hypothetical protein [Gaiellaceae bacterium]